MVFLEGSCYYRVMVEVLRVGYRPEGWRGVMSGVGEAGGYPSIEDVVAEMGGGPWRTKSGGELMVPTVLAFEEARRFLGEEEVEGGVGKGLRVYVVGGLQKGVWGGGEFHKVRWEKVMCVSGKVLWKVRDVYGDEADIEMTPGSAVYVPPWVLHSYTAQEDGACLVVMANTLFDPGNRDSWDTYSASELPGLVENFPGRELLGDL